MCVASNVTTRNTNVNRWGVEQATAHTGLVIVYGGSGSRMSVKLHLNVLRLNFKYHSRKTNTHGSTWKGNDELCWFRLVKTSLFMCISVKNVSQWLEITWCCQVSIVHHEKWLTRNRYRSKVNVGAFMCFVQCSHEMRWYRDKPEKLRNFIRWQISANNVGYWKNLALQLLILKNL